MLPWICTLSSFLYLNKFAQFGLNYIKKMTSALNSNRNHDNHMKEPAACAVTDFWFSVCGTAKNSLSDSLNNSAPD